MVWFLLKNLKTLFWIWICFDLTLSGNTGSNGPATWRVSANQIALFQKLAIYRIINKITFSPPWDELSNADELTLFWKAIFFVIFCCRSLLLWENNNNLSLKIACSLFTDWPARILLNLSYGCSYVAKIHFFYMISKKSFMFWKVFYIIKNIWFVCMNLPKVLYMFGFVSHKYSKM